MSGNQSWRTPDDFFNVVNKEFNFQFDAACTIKDKKCKYGFTYPEYDALTADWRNIEYLFSCNGIPLRHVWCNPPFKVMQPWVYECTHFVNRHLDNIAVLLAPLSCAPWIETCYHNAAEIRDIYPRIQFDPPPGVKRSSNAKDNVLVVFRHKPKSCKRFFWRWK